MTPLVAGHATGIGSWPGTDPREAAATVVGELPGLPHLVELPGRGLGADTIGRAAALLTDFPIDTSTTGYRTGARRSVIARRAAGLLSADLDALEEAWEIAGKGPGGAVKVQAPGPWTLAASLELAGGARLLLDRGAVRDLADSLGDGLASHAADVSRRCGGARVVVQLDEPLLTDVRAGRLTGRSRLESIPAVATPVAVETLDRVVAASAADVILHACSAEVPTDIAHESRVAALAFDLESVRTASLDGLGTLLDGGTELLVGAVPTTDPQRPLGVDDVLRDLGRLAHRLQFAPEVFAARVGLAPACGLAGASPQWARRALTTVRDAARAMADDPSLLTR
ncbi:methionine synthase [Rhodococcus rhodnii]|uniref:Cobalamin-independent methionine synthase MetE C-terminal/archaeal domain-containing protein n=2 Tax=Rhodococcus rhodnii TaxID=38312 RepID=R7WLM8_9NOCA|nr:methionine synthase [Rhodococcus rhodnii]EOM76207.1 hypothetical protein Rrhod_2412 [Rhodococcus rhodnii LMG 5362]TXG90765.1 methionine synthase [Rhodococcus rhodnii]